MPLIKPFPGLRPASGHTADVAAPPYDVMNEAEARAMVAGKPWSFLHVSRAEVDLPEGVNPYASEVYAKAAENLARMREAGVLAQDPEDCFYVYRLTEGDHVQTGLVAVASVKAYDQNRIKKHELTRPNKEDDRVRQIDVLDAQTGPVSLVYKAHTAVDGILAETAKARPDADVTADSGVRHQIWVISEHKILDRLVAAFDAMPALYVADGHHRSAAASRVAAARKATNPAHTGEEAYNYFLTVLFPHDQVRILDYNRAVRDLGGLDRETFVAGIGEHFSVTPSDSPVQPRTIGEFGMYLQGQWYKLTLDRETITDDPVESLDIRQLAD
ncbi:MAG: DUF1015 domain-containing protein, partial [Pseudomonadota bacterium]|nr:DUF1015 domain-containing protein [Pseudomonadota bacterium]